MARKKKSKGKHQKYWKSKKPYNRKKGGMKDGSQP